MTINELDNKLKNLSDFCDQLQRQIERNDRESYAKIAELEKRISLQEQQQRG